MKVSDRVCHCSLAESDLVPTGGRQCVAVIRTGGARDVSSYYEMWEAIVAVTGMCIRFGHLGVAYGRGAYPTNGSMAPFHVDEQYRTARGAFRRCGTRSQARGSGMKAEIFSCYFFSVLYLQLIRGWLTLDA